MRRLHMGFIALIATAAIVSGCSKQATEEECLQFAMQLDLKSFEKGKCEKYLEW